MNRRLFSLAAAAALAFALGARADADPPAGTAPAALGWVSGTVTDGEGKPFANAEIKVVRDKPPGAWTATSDAKGYFAVRGVPAGPAFALVSAKGRVTVRQEVKVPTTGAVTVDAKLELGVRFGGKVTDTDGKPIAKAVLTAFESSDEGRNRFGFIFVAAAAGSGSSAADGTFVVDGLRPGGTYRLHVAHPHFVPIDLTGLPAEAGGGHDTLDVTLESAAWLSGTVVDDAGNPVAGARVRGPDDEDDNFGGMDPFFARFFRQIQNREDKDASVSDARGHFELGSLKPGEAKITAANDAYFEGSVTTDALVAGKETTGIKIVLETATAWVEGTVLDGEGKGLAGVDLSLTGDVGPAGAGKTDATGKFRISRVRSHAAVTVQATKAGYVAKSAAAVELNTKVCKIELLKAARLKVKVLGEDGKPVPLVVVTLEYDEAPNRHSSHTSWQKQGEGGLDIELPIGDVTVNVSAPEHDVVEAGKWTAESGKTIDGGTVTLTKAGGD